MAFLQLVSKTGAAQTLTTTWLQVSCRQLLWLHRRLCASLKLGYKDIVKPFKDIRVVTLAVNLPGPLAVAELRALGATVVKIEPPDGDPLARIKPDWYRALHEGCEIVCLNLKDPVQRARLEEQLAGTDLLITATRPAALDRLGLAWEKLHARFPRLCQVAIVGYPPPQEDIPGHDLTYQAQLGLLDPPRLPRTMIADLAGAQEVVSAALALLFARERGQGANYTHVSLARAAEHFAEPLRQGLTTSGGLLGGNLPGYNLYRARDGWVALATLEPHFWRKLSLELGLSCADREQLQAVFLTRTALEWEEWGIQRDLPLAAVREAPEPEESQR
jgi:crotonobetainyl-CoA:carnitine CoA-transferase CaiB-like acyl-CoA transferase